VYGSDRSWSALLDDVKSQGISVSTDQSGAAIPADCDVLVYSEAIPEDAPERKAAEERGIRQMSYPQALGELSKNHRVIAVCGTHGKSSTTGMCARMLIECGLDPTIVVGTKLRELDGRNWREGKSDIFLLEACEYRRSFLNYSPSVILMTNADGDHYDYFDSRDDYREAFVEFAKKLPKDGMLITHMADPDCAAIVKESGATALDGDAQPLVDLQTPGLHMQKNAQLALGLADVLSIGKHAAQKAVSGYAGSWRRLEMKGTYKDSVAVIDDYAHHPLEIKATVSAIAGAYKPRRIVGVYQPHTHDRTIKLYREFLPSFKGLDLLFVTDVYDARADIETRKVRVPRLVGDISRESGVPTGWTGNLAATKLRLEQELQPNDVLLVMGAGDVTNLATQMTEKK
jgi:UDP-N-acetylmuramate--alanine ligase